jgi:hypothetical protein
MRLIYAAAFAVLISLGDANAGSPPVRKFTPLPPTVSKTYYKWYAPDKGIKWTVKLRHPRATPSP